MTDIVALRGDAPEGADHFTPHPEGFANSVELIEALAQSGQFTLRVGAYPEPHPEAASMAECVDHLKRKIDAGAQSAITQFFFEAETYFRFRDACAAKGLTLQERLTVYPTYLSDRGYMETPVRRRAKAMARADGLARSQALEAHHAAA